MLDRLQRQTLARGAPGAGDQIEELIQRIMERLSESGYISMTGKPTHRTSKRGTGRAGLARSRFEVTDKALDFLGYRALRDLLGSIGRASAGRHDTRELDTGIEVSGPPRPYEFGDTMNRSDGDGAERGQENGRDSATGPTGSDRVGATRLSTTKI
jgi:uncharacterized protein with von Willebrand factor type A (vWA) domain